MFIDKRVPTNTNSDMFIKNVNMYIVKRYCLVNIIICKNIYDVKLDL